MLKSMTGFARNQSHGDWGQLSWEVRSVNHRYLDINLRLPEGFQALEMKLRKRLAATLARGKLDCTLHYSLGEQGQVALALNKPLLTALMTAHQQVCHMLTQPQTQALSAEALMKWPGVISYNKSIDDRLLEEALNSFDKTIEQLVENRAQEGLALKQVLSEKLTALDELVVEASALYAQCEPTIKAQLQTKVDKLQLELEAGRLEQELVLLLNKADIHEEIDRLSTHIKQVAQLLQSKSAVGRRLDFFMQELNREANTIASKSTNAALTQVSVQMKVLIEQMREQIQNIE